LLTDTLEQGASTESVSADKEVPLEAEIKEQIEQLEQKPSDIPSFMAAGKVIAIDLFQLMELGDLSLNVLIGDGDVVYVPEAKRFHVVGYIKDAGSYALKKPTTVLEGVALARGVNRKEASIKKCALKRKTEEGEIVIPLDLRAIATGQEPNFYMQPDDIIDIRQTTARATYLELYNFITRVFGFTGRMF